MRTFLVLPILLGVALISPMVNADPAPGDVISVETDSGGTSGSCQIAEAEVPCPVFWDSNNTATPGDDRIESYFFVQDLHIIVRPPIGPDSPHEFSMNLSNIAIPNPAYRQANATWPVLNSSRPDEVRPYISFDSRPMHQCMSDGSWVEYSKWALDVDVTPPVPLSPAYSCSYYSLGWCYSLCFVDNQTYGQFTEDAIIPFPYGVFFSGESNNTFDTDAIVRVKFVEAESCEYVVSCDTSTAKPTLDAMDQTYEAVTPNAQIESELNQTDITIASLDSDAPSKHTGAHHEKHPAQGAEPQASYYSPPATESISDRADRTREAPSQHGDSASRQQHVASPRLSSTDGPSRPPANVAAIVVAIAAAATALLGVAWALYSRIQKSEVLSQGTRRRIWETLSESPGLRTAEIATKLGLSHNTVAHHLKALCSAGYVRAGEGDRPRYFLASQSAEEAARAGALAQPTLRAIYSALEREGVMDHSTLAKLVGVSAMSVGRCLRKLESAGLVRQRRVGRQVLVEVARPAPPASQGTNFASVAGAS